MKQPRQRPVGMRSLQQMQRIPRRHLTSIQYTVIPAGAPRVLHPSRHLRRVEAHIEFPARLSRLRNLERGTTETKDIAETDIRFGQTDGTEVLAEGPDLQGGRTQLRKVIGPGAVVLGGIMMHGLVHAAVMLQVAVLITGETGNRQLQRRRNTMFVD